MAVDHEQQRSAPVRAALNDEVRELAHAYDLDDAWLRRAGAGHPEQLTASDIRRSLGLADGGDAA